MCASQREAMCYPTAPAIRTMATATTMPQSGSKARRASGLSSSWHQSISIFVTNLPQPYPSNLSRRRLRPQFCFTDSLSTNHILSPRPIDKGLSAQKTSKLLQTCNIKVSKLCPTPVHTSWKTEEKTALTSVTTLTIVASLATAVPTISPFTATITPFTATITPIAFWPVLCLGVA